LKDLSHYIRELTHITYDRQALEDYYYSIQHKAKPYVEFHQPDTVSGEDEKSPYFRCICKKCCETEKQEHSGDKHKYIRKLKHPEIDRITSLINPIIGTDYPAFMWIYEPGFELRPHKDFTRGASVMVPILPAEGGATVHLYRDDLPVIDVGEYKTVMHNDDYVHHIHNYSTECPTILNAGEVIHGVINKEKRVFLNFSGNVDWE